MLRVWNVQLLSLEMTMKTVSLNEHVLLIQICRPLFSVPVQLVYICLYWFRNHCPTILAQVGDLAGPANKVAVCYVKVHLCSRSLLAAKW